MPTLMEGGMDGLSGKDRGQMHGDLRFCSGKGQAYVTHSIHGTGIFTIIYLHEWWIFIGKCR